MFRIRKSYLVLFFLVLLAPLVMAQDSPDFCSGSGCDVGSYYSDTCYVNHWYCEDSNANPITCELLKQAVRSSSFQMDCGAEQIDVRCFGEDHYDSVYARHGSCKPPATPIPSPTPTPSNTPTNTPSPTPTPSNTPTSTPTPEPTNTPRPVLREDKEPTPTPFCEEVDVKRVNQLVMQDSEINEADQLRIYLNSNHEIHRVINLTNYQELDGNGSVSGISLNGSIDPITGCYFAFQHQMPEEDDSWDIWIANTSGTGELRPITTSSQNASCAIEPEWTRIYESDWSGASVIYYTNTCEENRVYMTDIFGKDHQSLSLKGRHIDSSWDGRYLSFTDNAGFVQIYNVATGELTNLEIRGKAVWHANGYILYIVRSGMIEQIDFTTAQSGEYLKGQLLAADPRRQPEYDMVEIDSELFAYLQQTQDTKLIVLAGNLLHWDQDLPHTDPEWWRYYTERAETDTSSVAASLEEIAENTRVVPTPRVQEERNEASVSEERGSEAFNPFTLPNFPLISNEWSLVRPESRSTQNSRSWMSFQTLEGEKFLPSNTMSLEVVFWKLYFKLNPEVREEVEYAYSLLGYEDNARLALYTAIGFLLVILTTTVVVSADTIRLLKRKR